MGQRDDPWTSALGKAVLSCLDTGVVEALFRSAPPSSRTARTITRLAAMKAELALVRVGATPSTMKSRKWA